MTLQPRGRVLIGLLVSILLFAGTTHGDTGLAELVITVATADGPVEGAVIVVRGDGLSPRLTVTNKTGNCRFSSLEPGMYSVSVVHGSFLVAQDSESELKKVEIVAGQRHSLNLAMIKGAVVTGQLVTPNGRPVVGMPVSALKVTLSSGKVKLLPRNNSDSTVLTDDRGQFRIYGLAPSRYAIAVNARRNAYQLKTVSTLYYPGQRELANAATFPIVAGQETAVPELIVDLASESGTPISGHTIGLRDTPLGGVHLTLQQTDGGYLADAISDREGYFNFQSLPAGRYVLKGKASVGNYFAAEQEVVVDHLLTKEITLQLRPYVIVQGQVNFQNRIESKSGPLEIILACSLPSQDLKDLNVAPDTSGNFLLRTGREGLFWWRFPKLDPDSYLRRVNIGGKDVTHKPLTIDQTRTLERISLEITPGAVKITGEIANQSQACSHNNVYAVAMAGVEGEILFVKGANRCEGSSFSIYSLPPGEYYVVALQSGQDSTGSARNRSDAMDDHQFQLLQKAIESVAEKNKPVKLTEKQMYIKALPIVVKLPVSQPTVKQ